MRKPRRQRAFAALTQNEIDQIAHWLMGHNTYDAVRERVAKPRPEGFGLAVSNGALRRLFAKTAAFRLEQHLFDLRLKKFDGDLRRAILNR